MNLHQLGTIHFWLALAGNATGAALAFLVLTGSPHVVVMGCLALAIVVLNQAGVSTAASWLPPSVQAKLKDGDLTRYVENGLAALRIPAPNLGGTGSGGVIMVAPSTEPSVVVNVSPEAAK